MPTKKTIRAVADDRSIIAMQAEIEIKAAEGDAESKGPPTFDVVAYRGGAVEVANWDRPVVIDIAGMDFARSVIGDLFHNNDQLVGHATEKEKTESEVRLKGVMSAATQYTDQVVTSAANGFPWEASVEVRPAKKGVEEIDAGKKVTVNGQEFTGPLYVARKSTLSGFGFVPHGADPTTEVKIAAGAASQKENQMDEKLQAFIEAMLPGVDIKDLSDEAVANLKADMEGKSGKRITAANKGGDIFAQRKAEVKRRTEIREIADKFIEMRNADLDEIEAIEKMHDHAIEASMGVQDFRLAMYESSVPQGHTVFSPKRSEKEVSAEVIEAAICVHGRLSDVEKRYSDRVLQAAHDRFKHGIGLGEVLMLGAVESGYRARPGERVTDGNLKPVLAHAFATVKAQGFSTFSLPTSFSNVANKFVRDGWNFVDQSWRDIATVRSVTDFKEITTVSLVDGLIFQPLAPNGEIKHGTVSETTYGNKADTYARMFVVDRRDIINDDLSVLTKVPQKLGRGGALKLNDIFWAEWVNPSVANFWHSSHVNVNEGVATMTIAGLTATETIFKALRGPDGNLLGSKPRILLVPPVHSAAALTLMSSERLIDGTSTAAQGDANIFRGRFKVVESSYLADTSYTGFDVDAWWLLADPNDIPAIEVVALNGRVEPTLDTAEANFNVLGFQMRGYSDVGVRVQEPLAGVRADNGSS